MEFITLKNKDTAKLIEGVILHPLKINRDESGILVETLRKDWEGIYGKDREFFMQYYSVTNSGVARDENSWHLHPTYQEDRFIVIRGELITAVADNRENSPTKGLLNLFHMKAEDNPFIVLIPKNTLHGFIVVSKEPAVLVNFPTGLYNPEEEKRIPFGEVNIRMADGNGFSWDLIRKEFPFLSS